MDIPWFTWLDAITLISALIILSIAGIYYLIKRKFKKKVVV